ncbi:hypothetical protein [Burkholderia cepacia]|uniref:hypothetical protein n=1 Tax=Burkholderia cepacia TaxID=292 RepID=UPI003D673E30
MSEIKDGGPAFPIADPFALNPRDKADMERLASGMTLRDYFAAKAMAAHISRFQAEENSIDFPRDDTIAQWAYEHADAMIRARGE